MEAAGGSPHVLQVEADDSCISYSEQLSGSVEQYAFNSRVSMEANLDESSKCAGISPKLVCTSCSQRFVNPRILPCLHTFCSECISGFRTYPINCPDLNDSGEREELSSAKVLSSAPSLDQPSFDSADGKTDDTYYHKKRMILCPDCLREVEIATDVSELHKNHVVERKLAEDCLQNINNNIPQFCDSCVDLTEGSVVRVRCVECSESLCSYCEQAHRRQRRTKGHHLVSVNEPTDTDKKRKSIHRQIFCPRHTSEELKLFCSSCDEVVCRDCVVLDHRDHQCQFVSSDLFRTEMDSMQLLIKNVVPKVNAVEARLKSVSTLKDKIRTRAKQVESEINKFMDSYIQAIEKHRQALIGQIDSLVKDRERSLNVTELHLKDSKGEVGETCKLVSELIDSGSDLEILTVKKLITGRLNRLNSLPVDPKTKINDFVRFSPEEKADVINDFQMYGKVVSRQVTAAKSTVDGDGLSTARIGHKSQMTLTVRDTEHVQYNGSDVNVRAWLIYQNESLRSVPVNISCKKDGTHQLTFTPVQKGTHFLHVAVSGQPVKDSPFKFSVKARWREHKGIWQCCTFCQTGGKRDVTCGCKGAMPGGFAGCGHGHGNHPGGPHWSCCGKMVKNSECSVTSRPSPLRQVTL
ncbi:E3 ubiquitin-protein ligase TRIM45-like [Haliotis cracherodii]|uniref:E3 ubiquitin-protein ligase TRIM45-like n=1 Tax=Haliotis cracherodii TaxID=6455 RepID=UPI0039EB5849